jgi:hypothetical protein
LLVPEAALKPAEALVVLLSHKYVIEPFPPVAVEPINVLGVEPVQIVCADEIELFDSTGLTVISMAEVVMVGQTPALTERLYHVVAVNAPGL